MRDLEHLRRRYADHVPGLLGARHSYAVLCPLVERPDGLHLLFEVRSAALHRQPGEVCFPGGRMEAGETPEQCALRETEEELAIPRQEVEVPIWYWQGHAVWGMTARLTQDIVRHLE